MQNPFRTTTPRAARRGGAAAALAAAAALSLAAPAAQADSIAYIKGGNVWLSTGDGARQFQVTATGDYSDVSQADDGTMIALSGVRLRKLDRYGDVLADFDTPVSDTSPPGSRTFWGPFDPAISPDGTKVAYSWFYMSQSQAPGCYPPQCVTAINNAGTGYSHSDRTTDWSEPGFAEHTGWRNPAWVDNATTVLSDPSHLPNSDVVVDQPASRPGATGFLVNNWFSDSVGGNPHVSGGDISRDKTKAAFVTGQNDSTLTVYSIPSFPTAFPSGDAPASTIPSVCYRYGNPVGGSFGTPTFSPDGAKIAFAVGNGVHVANVPSLSSGCTTTGASANSQLLLPGATQPDWGPAGVPTARPTPPPTQKPPVPGRCKSKVSCPGHRATTLTVTGTSLHTALRRGLRVTVAGAGKRATVRLVARAGRRVVATESARAGASGKMTIRLRFSHREAVRLQAQHRVVLVLSCANATVRVTLRG